MQHKGVNYDVGHIYLSGASSRPEFDRRVVRREIEIIRHDLNCNAIRISGLDIERLVYAAECAAATGLEAWISPAMIDAGEEDALAYMEECAAAEQLRVRSPGVVFICGCEHTIFLKGLVDGATFLDRIGRLSEAAFWREGGAARAGADLNAFLARVSDTVRRRFLGPITYASGSWEQVDWTPFDIVSVDLYRDSSNQDKYSEKLRAYARHGKPVAVTEFGCCTYAGADLKGGMGWAIVDWSKVPVQLDGPYIRDEASQARLITELLAVFDDAGIAGAFVFTFVNPIAPYDANPIYDLDMASYGVVKTLAGANGLVYPDMPWEPKESFNAISRSYASLPVS
jgi:hypothetical protein